MVIHLKLSLDFGLQTNVFCADYNRHWFWTSAIRDENSTVWYWETTGAELKWFDWGQPGYPSMDENLVRSCISFLGDLEGFADQDCEMYVKSTMCE
jgi:hypothetical protein